VADVPVEVVNNAGQTVRLTLDEDGEFLAHLRKMVRAEDLESVKVLKPSAPARKPAPAKP
jgi:hypothetical protein